MFDYDILVSQVQGLGKSVRRSPDVRARNSGRAVRQTKGGSAEVAMKAPDIGGSSAWLLMAVLLAAPAHSEEGPPLVSGQRLRVTTVAAGHFTGVMVGNLLKIRPDSLSLADSERAGVTEIPLGSVAKIEVSHG